MLHPQLIFHEFSETWRRRRIARRLSDVGHAVEPYKLQLEVGLD
jgi:hypothetical protein